MNQQARQEAEIMNEFYNCCFTAPGALHQSFWDEMEEIEKLVCLDRAHSEALKEDQSF